MRRPVSNPYRIARDLRRLYDAGAPSSALSAAGRIDDAAGRFAFSCIGALAACPLLAAMRVGLHSLPLTAAAAGAVGAALSMSLIGFGSCIASCRAARRDLESIESDLEGKGSHATQHQVR